ncbi:MAG TPA: hypothetical protein VFA46_03435 [Actinomycetes bacterium]|nr:hypothetical protein [Actinomycetes bacterium]
MRRANSKVPPSSTTATSRPTVQLPAAAATIDLDDACYVTKGADGRVSCTRA